MIILTIRIFICNSTISNRNIIAILQQNYRLIQTFNIIYEYIFLVLYCNKTICFIFSICNILNP
nr:MAG TPA: hypothetical protein [Caudoviricetes sp.]